MDPTMQSPVRRTSPFSAGTQIDIPAGPHHYRTEYWVGSISQGNSPQQAFQSLKRHVIPFQRSQESVNGEIMDVPGLGPIRQFVDPDRLTIVNTTLPGHELHPGNVHRSIVQKGKDLYVVTEGYGTGAFPRANERGSLIWAEPDHRGRYELNSFTADYPMDEMNAVAKPARPAAPAPASRSTDRPERRIPPPIFFPPYRPAPFAINLPRRTLDAGARPEFH